MKVNLAICYSQVCYFVYPFLGVDFPTIIVPCVLIYFELSLPCRCVIWPRENVRLGMITIRVGHGYYPSISHWYLFEKFS